MLTSQSRQNYKKFDPYLVQKIMSASSEQLISYIYDAAIVACSKEDSIRAGKAVRELMNSLNFNYKEIALVFYNVYRYINNIILKGKYEEARVMLIDLRKTWQKSMKVS